MTNKILIIAGLHLILSGTALAQDSLLCRTKIVNIGMQMEAVRKFCGAPDYSSVDEQAVHDGNRIRGTTAVTTWHYIQPGSLRIAVLVFDLEKLQSIRYVNKMDEDL